MSAEDVGWSSNRMVLGKHSGRNAFKQRLNTLGIEFGSDDELNEAFVRFKDMADRKHEIFDDDLQALVTESGNEAENDRFILKHLQTHSETGQTPTARIVLVVDGKETTASETGNGAVDATFKAIEKIMNSGSELQLYSVNSITSGTDAQGEVSVRLEKDGHIVNGHGADLDIIIASAKSYINALNKLFSSEARTHPQLAQAI